MGLFRLVKDAVRHAGSECRNLSREPIMVFRAAIQPVRRDALPETDQLGRRLAALYRLFAVLGDDLPIAGDLVEQDGAAYLVEELIPVRAGGEALYVRGLLRPVSGGEKND